MFCDFHIRFTRKYSFSSNKHRQRLLCRSFKGCHLLDGSASKREALTSKKRRAIYMKLEIFVIVSVQLTVRNYHYDM